MIKNSLHARSACLCGHADRRLGGELFFIRLQPTDCDDDIAIHSCRTSQIHKLLLDLLRISYTRGGLLASAFMPHEGHMFGSSGFLVKNLALSR